MNSSSTLTYARANRRQFLSQLSTFLRFPSVSVQPQHARDLQRCAEWLAEHLRRIGLESVRVIRTARHPLVFAEWCHLPNQPTVLVYGHYDVQPVDPLNQWRVPPFTPVVRNGNLYARGASDDKGPLFCHVAALESLLKTTGRLPVNLLCLFEGEEEIGSPNLKPWIMRHRDLLTADVAVISDTRFRAPGRPAITVGLRGGLGLELTVSGPRRDLHSGSFGGALHNPIQALCEIIARLHDSEGRIVVPGLYKRVHRLTQPERAAMAHSSPSDNEILRNAGVARGWGEHGFSAFERTTIRPALTINGITGGYQGEGGKGIIPAQASAKISLRLVPDQQPDEIERLLRRQIARITPPTVRSRLITTTKSKPVLLDHTHPAIQAAVAAYQHGFGATPVFLRSGGLIPVVNMLYETLGIPTVLMGFSLPDDRNHAPNEKFALSQFFLGIETCVHFLVALSTDSGTGLGGMGKTVDKSILRIRQSGFC